MPEMGRETWLRGGANMVRFGVALLTPWLVLSAACSKPVPGQAHLGTPGGDSTVASAVPEVAWIDANTLPLNNSERWPQLASLAQPLTDSDFEISSLCHVAPEAFFEGTESARARIERGANRWSLQQQIVHYAGDPWTMGQRALAVFNSLVESVKNCDSSAPGAHVGITTPDSNCENLRPCSQFAATIEVPADDVVAHVYLSSAGSAVTELSLWSSPTPSPLSAPSDATIFDAMNPRLCTAWPC
jgi:hypothetical protein